VNILLISDVSVVLSDVSVVLITTCQVRPISYEDFVDALKQVRASVSEKDLDVYMEWNKQYGSWSV